MAEPIVKLPRVGWRDPMDGYEVLWGGDRICFREEPGVLLTATVADGVYSDLELAGLVKRALESAGTGTYAVWRDEESEKFIIQQLLPASGYFDLVMCASAILPLMGFTSGATGTTIYTADFPTPDMMYLDFLEPVRNPDYTVSLDRSEKRALAGQYRVTSAAVPAHRWEGDLTFRSFSHLEEYLEFSDFAIEGHAFRWWQDQRAWGVHRWIKSQLDQDSIKPAEQLPLFKHWVHRIKLIQSVANDGPISLRDLQDR